MLTTSLFLLMVLSSQIESKISHLKHEISPLSHASIELIKPLTSTLGVRGFSLMTSTKSNLKSQNLKEDILQRIPIDCTIRNEMLEESVILDSGRRRKRVIFIVENYEIFNDHLYPNMKNNLFRLSGNYLIILSNGKFNEIDEMMEKLWILNILNVNVVFEAKEIVYVQTFMPFDKENCYNFKLKTINQFINGKFIKQNSSLFPDKSKNLFGCPIRVSTSEHAVPHVRVKKHINGSIDYYGRDMELMKVLSDKINFKLEITTNDSYQDVIFENGSSSGQWKRILENQTDIIIGDYYITGLRLKFLGISNYYSFEDTSIVIAQGRKLTSFEKIIYPLKKDTWKYLIITYIIGMIVISLTRRCNKFKRNFVFGTGVKSPHFNMFSIFMGISLTQKPKRNFSRFLMMSFILFSMIMRTAYIASYFEVVHSDIRLKEPQSIEEIFNKNFTWQISAFYFTLFGDESEVNKRIFLGSKTITNSSNPLSKVFNDFPDNLALVNARTTISLNINRKIKDSVKNDTSGNNEIGLKILKQNLYTSSIVFYTRKDYFLTDKFNKYISRMVESGLTKYWHFKEFDKNLWRLKKSKSPKQIKLSHLDGIFKIWLFGLAISCIAFIIEKCSKIKF